MCGLPVTVSVIGKAVSTLPLHICVPFASVHDPSVVPSTWYSTRLTPDVPTSVDVPPIVTIPLLYPLNAVGLTVGTLVSTLTYRVALAVFPATSVAVNTSVCDPAAAPVSAPPPSVSTSSA